MTIIKIKFSLFIISFILLSHISYSQNVFSDFIKASDQDLNVLRFDDQIEYLGKKRYRSSPIQGLQLRAQNNELGSGNRELGLRVTPANPWEIRNTNRMYQSYKKALFFEKHLKLKEILVFRYSLIISAIYQHEMKDLQTEDIRNIKSQISIFEKQSGSEFFDAEDYVDLKLELLQRQTDIEATEFAIAQIHDDILKEEPAIKTSSFETSYNEIISVSRISEVIDSLLSFPLFSTTHSFYRERIEMSNYEYKLEKNNLNIGFIQPEYNFNRAEDESPIGISLGISIPLFNPNKADMAGKKLDLIEAESELAVETKLAQVQVARLSNSLKNYISRYNNIQAKIDSFSVDKTFNTVGALNSNNPLIFLKFNEQILKLKKLKIEVTEEIFLTYINLLAAADLLQQGPLINFLAKELK